MSFTLFLVVFVVFAGAIALWCDLRFPKLAPAELRPAIIRLLVAFALAHVAVPAVGYFAGGLPHPGPTAIVLTTGFVAMALLMLATIWVLRLAQGMLGGSLR